MPGTIIVLVVVLTLYLLFSVAFLVSASVLARRNGQKLRSVGWSPFRGCTAEFYSERKQPK